MLYYPSYSFADHTWYDDHMNSLHLSKLARRVIAKRNRNTLSASPIGYAVSGMHFHNHVTNNRYKSLHQKHVSNSRKNYNQLPEGIYTTFFYEPNTLYYITPHFL